MRWVNWIPSARDRKETRFPPTQRLFGTSFRTVQQERAEERLVSLLGAYAAEALLIAFTMNLRLTSLLGGAAPAKGAAETLGRVVQAGLTGAGAAAATRASGFLGMGRVGQSAAINRMSGIGGSQASGGGWAMLL